MRVTGRDKLVAALGSAVITYLGFAFVSWDLTPWHTDSLTRFMMLGVFIALYGSSLAYTVVHHE